jgi:hypothetical protein
MSAHPTLRAERTKAEVTLVVPTRSFGVDSLFDSSVPEAPASARAATSIRTRSHLGDWCFFKAQFILRCTENSAVV